ncbi:hypothetical protein ABPG72_022480 [Tetrahymena utriculariae]
MKNNLSRESKIKKSNGYEPHDIDSSVKSSLNRSIQSAIVRKYEDLKQSINLQNQMRPQINNIRKLGLGFEERQDIPHHTNLIFESQNITIDRDQEQPLKQNGLKETSQKIQKDLVEKTKKDLQQKRYLGRLKLIELWRKQALGQIEGIWMVNFIQRVDKWFCYYALGERRTLFQAYGLTPDDPSNINLAIVLLIVIFITAFITFQQNAKSEALLKYFKNLLSQKCTAIRNGLIKQRDSLKLVVGDIVLIKAGEKIPADIRILESSEMKVDNSPLTGESEPQLRTVECSHPENYLETTNIAFFGTLCKEGTAKVIVICTGDRTTLGQIENLFSGEKKVKTPLRAELDRFIYMITVLAFFLCILFFLLAYLVIGFPIMSCIVFGIGILAANVPEGLFGCITICLAITAKNLARKQVLVKNLEAVETLGCTSCICSDKTGTLTQNIMTLKHLWVNDTVIETTNFLLLQQGQQPKYDVNKCGFKTLKQAAMISSEAVFDNSSLQDQINIDYLKCLVIDDATETGIIRFFQPIEDVNKFRRRFQIAKNPDETLSKMPFSSQYKFSLTIVQEETINSHYCIYIKGAPKKIWSFCSKIFNNNNFEEIDDLWNAKFKKVNLDFGKKGERVQPFSYIKSMISDHYILRC